MSLLSVTGTKYKDERFYLKRNNNKIVLCLYYIARWFKRYINVLTHDHRLQQHRLYSLIENQLWSLHLIQFANIKNLMFIGRADSRYSYD